MDQLQFKGARMAVLVDNKVGERIRQRRTMLGYTQEQLADALDISYQQVQKYESGANRISAGRLYQIARRLEVDVGYFFQGLGGLGDAEDQTGGGGSSRSVIDLVRSFQSIPDPALRGSILNLVKNAASATADGADETISRLQNGAAEAAMASSET